MFLCPRVWESGFGMAQSVSSVAWVGVGVVNILSRYTCERRNEISCKLGSKVIQPSNRPNMKECRAFYAYASLPEEVCRTVADTIKLANEIDGGLRIVDWTELRIAGKLVIYEVCKNIAEADLFICDLSTHNHNVLFELGYAIAKRKLVWITVNEEYADAKQRYRYLKPITTVGYIGYKSAYELRNKLLREYKALGSLTTILDAHINIIQSRKERVEDSLFYMKSWTETPESIALDRILYKSKLRPIYDDPQQGTGQSLAYYIDHTFHATAVLAHLSSSADGNSVNDAKYALAAGLAHGFDKPLLMLAHTPHESPIDYRAITFEHTNPASCVAEFRRWSADISLSVRDRRPTREDSETASRDLRNIDIGHYLAENEETSLPEYFVQTTAYFEALDAADYMLFVGRKGTGKTANLFMLANTIASESDTHVCIIRPFKYEFEGILNLFGISRTIADKGYLLQAIWKFLVYTELANSVYRNIDQGPVGAVQDEAVIEFMKFVAANEDVIGPGFAERLENALNRICEMEVFGGTPDEKSKVSEILHQNVIGKLREFVGNVLGSKRKVAILIDNLDEGWERRDNLGELADFLFGLISVSREIADDFNREKLHKPRVNLSVIVFLRSDIFYFIRQNSREADKLVYSQIDWSDTELLWQVAEKRFETFAPNIADRDVSWRDFFVSEIDGTPIEEYVMNRVIPRPRDLIYLFRASLVNAKNHNHAKILDSDIQAAELEYSDFAIELLLAEVNKVNPFITKELIFEFYGEKEVLLDDEIKERLDIGGISSAVSDHVIEVFVENSFLAIETSDLEFTFIYEDRERERIYAKARKNREKYNRIRYRIHPAFHPALEIVTGRAE